MMKHLKTCCFLGLALLLLTLPARSAAVSYTHLTLPTILRV